MEYEILPFDGPATNKPRRQRKSREELDQEISRGNYDAYRAEANALGETNDCSVRAVAAACGVSYREAHTALAKCGRKRREGCYVQQIHDAVRMLGFEVVRMPMFMKDMAHHLYVRHNYKVKNITTRQMTMFPNFFGEFIGLNEVNGALCYTSGHVAAWADGHVHDFGASRALQVRSIYLVVKK